MGGTPVYTLGGYPGKFSGGYPDIYSGDTRVYTLGVPGYILWGYRGTYPSALGIPAYLPSGSVELNRSLITHKPVDDQNIQVWHPGIPEYVCPTKNTRTPIARLPLK